MILSKKIKYGSGYFELRTRIRVKVRVEKGLFSVLISSQTLNLNDLPSNDQNLRPSAKIYHNKPVPNSLPNRAVDDNQALSNINMILNQLSLMAAQTKHLNTLEPRFITVGIINSTLTICKFIAENPVSRTNSSSINKIFYSSESTVLVATRLLTIDKQE